MIKSGVIGYPVKHSLSPIIHNYWLKKYNIDGRYDAYEVKPEDLNEFLVGMIGQGLSGCNVTIPHKENVLKYLEKAADPFAKFIGAVNTIIIKDKNFICTNTDFIGFSRNLIENAPAFEFTAGKAVVIGAGGAARAVVFSLMAMKIPSIVIINRTLERAENIRRSAIENFNYDQGMIKISDFANLSEELKDTNILVNATSLGMVGQKNLEIDISNLPTKALVTDIVYNPLETELLKTARKRGNIIVDGLGMLLHQAAPGFEAWFGVKPEVDNHLRDYIMERVTGK